MTSQFALTAGVSILSVLASSTWAATPAIFRSADSDAAVEFRFSEADENLLEEIQHGCFLYLWREVGEPAQLVRDRKTVEVSSIAAVGFQLSALPIGVERGWITREEGARRARTVLQSLLDRDDNKKFGVYLHFVDRHTGGLPAEAPEFVASTIDHALLAAGAIPAGVYFGGEVATLVDRLMDETNWRALINQDGFLSMGWRSNQGRDPSGDGSLLEARWTISSDEERLIHFLAVGAPRAEHAIEPAMYYRLQRTIERHGELPEHVVSWNGSLFTYFFSHCWINYRDLEADDPTQFGVESPRVDWFENSRRAIMSHRGRCIEQASELKTFGPNRWGLSPCMGLDSEGKPAYLVPEVQPNLAGHDNWIGGTVAPYAAGSAIMFTPKESLAALREFRRLRDADGKLLAWRDPDSGGYGLLDSFNLDQSHASEDYIGIDVGPMLLAIENVRTGLIWRLFAQHAVAKRAHERLRFEGRMN